MLGRNFGRTTVGGGKFSPRLWRNAYYSSALKKAPQAVKTSEGPAYPHVSTPSAYKSIQVLSNWHTLDDQPLSSQSIKELFSNTISTIRHPNFLSAEECARIVEIIRTEEIGTYNPHFIYPPVGHIGISQFDTPDDKDAYLNGVTTARSLQERLKREANVDIVGRVCNILRETSGLPVRMAKEADREYFAGLVRVVDNTIQIHADYGPFQGPGWEIGDITGQLTWNVLFKQVKGGDTIIYDRQWQGKTDDERFRKPLPSYAYSPAGMQGQIFKVMPPIEGHLTFFNPRNFHEVKPCDRTFGQSTDDVRYTMSSFVGFLPESTSGGPALILWS